MLQPTSQVATVGRGDSPFPSLTVANPSIKRRTGVMGDSFSSDVVKQLNAKWLPDEAGTSCLLLLSRLTEIECHWLFLTDEESVRNCQHQGDGQLPIPDPIRERRLTNQKVEWLRVRLPKLLRQLGRPDEWGAFLKDVGDLDRSYSPSLRVGDPGLEWMPKPIRMGMEGLKWQLLGIGQEKELPKGWNTLGWDRAGLGIQPVRTIPELISHLEHRAGYVSRPMAIRPLGPGTNHISEEGHRHEVLQVTLLNVPLAVRKYIQDPQRWPKCDHASQSFEQSRIRLEELIRELSVIAKDANKEPRNPGDKSSTDDRTEGRQVEEKKNANTRVAAVYDWAIENIPGADEMTIKELFNAIRNDSRMEVEYLDQLPDNHDTFGSYMRRAGIRRYNTAGDRVRRPSRKPNRQ